MTCFNCIGGIVSQHHHHVFFFDSPFMKTFNHYFHDKCASMFALERLNFQSHIDHIEIISQCYSLHGVLLYASALALDFEQSMGLEYCILYNMVLLHHLSSIPFIHRHRGATRNIISQYSFTQTLVGLHKGGIEGEPLVTS